MQLLYQFAIKGFWPEELNVPMRRNPPCLPDARTVALTFRGLLAGLAADTTSQQAKYKAPPPLRTWHIARM
jgi:hypothetical protein